MSILLKVNTLLTEVSNEQQEVLVGGQVIPAPAAPVIPPVTLAPVTPFLGENYGYDFGGSSPIDHGSTTYNKSISKGNNQHNELAGAFQTGNVF